MLITQQREEVEARFVEWAREKGVIYYDDILRTFPYFEEELAPLDDLFDKLLAEGIKITDLPQSEDDEDANDATITFSPVTGTETIPPLLLTERGDEEETEEISRTAFREFDLSDDAGYQLALDSDDSIGLYLKEAGHVPLLTAEMEVELAKRMENGLSAQEHLAAFGDSLSPADVFDLQDEIQDGEDAKEHLIWANTRLVINIAKKYKNRGVPFLDLIQEGNIGLMRATEKFEYRRGHKFSTYATWWIRQAVSRAVADQGRTIRVPVHMGDQLNRMRKIQHQLTQEKGREPTIEEIAVGFDPDPEKRSVMVEKVEHLQEISRRPISMDDPLDDDSDATYGDFIPDKDSPSPADEVAETLMKRDLQSALLNLPEREAHILRLRYGLNEETRIFTLEEVGRKINVTRERVRQLETQALNRLRQSSAHVKLKGYLTD
ncbi:MAG: sigma-70 family RNA polymerase sigma factor [Anaerolineaceae bacterium]|nr:sigma-70 family RNA polymerase sigma factor [Anaerolineaceae bacterium]MCY4010067.1 sigma-70 family RNA polymerase sigma factor [Anaerolineaceae bacterium]